MEKLDYNNKSSHYLKEKAYIIAQKSLKEIKGFYWHAFWYAVVNIFIFIMILINSDGNIFHFGTFSTPVFWVIGLGFHGLSVFGKNLFFSKSWEDRKMKEFMKKEEEIKDKHRFK
jgi:hypothetical protein